MTGQAHTNYDAVVIGSGFGGSVAALRLSEKGYRVLVLEMGQRFAPEDFAKTNWNLRKFLWKPAVGLHGIMQMTFLSDVVALHGAGVGGGSLVYANTLLEPSVATLSGAGWIGGGWAERLKPHYFTAKQMLGVTRAPEIYAGDKVLQEVVAEMGFGDTFKPADVGVYFGEAGKSAPDPYFGGQGPDRTGCTHCGACMVGCRVGAKNTLDKNYLYLAEKLGAEILALHRATEITPTPSGYRVSVEHSLGHAPTMRSVECTKVILAAGVLGTVPLLLQCQERGSLPKLSRTLGDFVRTNSEALLGVRARGSDVDYSRGIAIAAGGNIDADTHVEIVRYNKGSDVMANLATLLTAGGPPWPRPLRWLGTILRHPLQALRSLIPMGWAERAAILLVMQPVDNYLRVRLKRRWFWPFAKSLVSERSTSRPIPVYFPRANQAAAAMAKKMDGIAQSGLLEVLTGRAMTAHILGGCPMGTTSDDGVIDSRCEVLGYPGMYVVDGSAVPGNLGVNPSLTITALAEYAMSVVPRKQAP